MKPHEGASSSRITLVMLAESMVEDCDCICDDSDGDEDYATAFCSCAGDCCWHCAAKMALANAAAPDALSRTREEGRQAGLREAAHVCKRRAEQFRVDGWPEFADEHVRTTDAIERLAAQPPAPQGGTTK